MTDQALARCPRDSVIRSRSCSWFSASHFAIEEGDGDEPGAVLPDHHYGRHVGYIDGRSGNGYAAITNAGALRCCRPCGSGPVLAPLPRMRSTAARVMATLPTRSQSRT